MDMKLERIDPLEKLVEHEQNMLSLWLADGPDFDEVLKEWMKDKRALLEYESEIRVLASDCAFARSSMRNGDYDEAFNMLERGEDTWMDILKDLDK